MLQIQSDQIWQFVAKYSRKFDFLLKLLKTLVF